jgi:D-sedoheptulose 7-phosphate isomerase
MKLSTKKILDECINNFPLLEQCKQEIIKAFDILVECFKNNGKLLVCGNGGSCADAGHIVGELMNKFGKKRALLENEIKKIKESSLSENDKNFLLCHLQKSFPAISLCVHTSLITAISNDEDAEMIYAQQVYGYGKEGDVLLAISTSGNSKNILRALMTAKVFNIKTIGLTGKNGGKMKEHNCDVLICVPEEITYKIQQLHLPVYHCLCGMIEEELS